MSAEILKNIYFLKSVFCWNLLFSSFKKLVEVGGVDIEKDDGWEQSRYFSEFGNW